MSELNHCIYEFGPFRLDAQKRLLLRDGEPVKLFPKEFDTLLALVERGGEVLDKDELMQRVWGETIVEESNLSSNISHLRKLLGESPSQHDYIVTIPGRGYRFVARVKQTFQEAGLRPFTPPQIDHSTQETVAQRQADSNSEEGTQTIPALLAEKAAVAEPANHPTLRRLSPRLVAIATLIVAIAGIGVFSFLTLWNSKNLQDVPFREMKMTRLTNSGRATRAIISPDGRYVVYVMDDTTGQSLWVRQVATSSNIQIVAPIQGAYKGLTFSPDGNHVYCVSWEGDKADTELLQVPILGGPATKLPVVSNTAIGFSPDGNRFAYIVNDQGQGETLLRVANANGGLRRVLTKRKQPDFFSILSSPAWSPDGKKIACAVEASDAAGRFMRVIEISVEDGTEKWFGARRWASIAQLAWLPDHRGLVLIASDQRSSPEQVWYVSSNKAVKITNDLNNYAGLGLTADSGRLVTVQTNTVSSIWVAPYESRDPLDEANATQIASEVGGLEEISWTPEGQIVYGSHTSGRSNLWMSTTDGSKRRQLTIDSSAGNTVSVSPDGRYLVFVSDRTGKFHIWRSNIDGSNLLQLTSGDGELYPHCSPDGRWVIYQSGYGWVRPTLWKVPLEGGESMQLTGEQSIRPFVAPDGKRVAYYYMDEQKWHIGICSLDDGSSIKSFTLPPTVVERILRWTPDGNSIAYIDRRGGVDNIWALPMDGSSPRQLTGFKSDKIRAFDWSRDGRLLGIVRVSETSDVILISNSMRDV
jgi:Tol biopolymer transport system component/DNA-binding winged helix-turn-helix (wHTH) protein